MTTRLLTEPSEIYAGDYASWVKSVPDFPANAGAMLYYYFVGLGNQYVVQATAEGADFLVELSDTGTWVAGRYTWYAKAINSGGQATTIATGSIIVKTNYVAQNTGADTRGHAQKVLDAIEAVLEGRAARDQESMKIGDKELRRTPIADLLKLRDYYKAEAARDRAGERINQGLGSGNKIMTRFIKK